MSNTSGLLSVTVKAMGNHVLTKKMDKVMNIDRQRQYFTEKRMAHKGFHEDESTLTNKERSDDAVKVDDIIKNKRFEAGIYILYLPSPPSRHRD